MNENVIDIPNLEDFLPQKMMKTNISRTPLYYSRQHHDAEFADCMDTILQSNADVSKIQNSWLSNEPYCATFKQAPCTVG